MPKVLLIYPCFILFAQLSITIRNHENKPFKRIHAENEWCGVSNFTVRKGVGWNEEVLRNSSDLVGELPAW